MIDARDTALIIEGGGMRNSYTAPAVVKFIEEGVRFGWVGGVSAGSVHAANYASRDAERAKAAFTDLVSHPKFGGWLKLVRGQGYFNSEFIYGESEALLPFDFEAFTASEVELHVEAMRADTGDTVAWTRRDFARRPDLIFQATRASSTVPKVMPITLIDDAPYVDGALGESGGLLIDAAQRAGFDKFLVLATRPRDFVKNPIAQPAAVRRFFRRYPAIGEALLERARRYNASKSKILAAEAAGRAVVLFPDDMQVESTERRLARLDANYLAGERQVEREWARWEKFLA
ncbi:patatin family protein [Corynebacterium liangguodongii]|uniref:Patatin family protein n=1 Tax=Corynebacterium liangguodongii TaxID=2079535 RepID=A0A2S0WD67_9CORY|nr:patatin family protein [Corynebacterium liangguodongii]AWB83706.1 patatin family protein [Corynebacterium liangguodongii]PWB99484.1 patatin family protein [Corynebacterium liangguodongii]